MDNKFVRQWPEMWEEITPNIQHELEAELKRELFPGHPLWKMTVRAIVRHIECDDVLFTIDNSPSVAVVHLSYSHEANPLWPHTQFFNTLSDWHEQENIISRSSC